MLIQTKCQLSSKGQLLRVGGEGSPAGLTPLLTAMGGVLGRRSTGYNDSDDDQMPIGVELVAQNERGDGDAAIDMPRPEPIAPPAVSPLLFGGNIFPNGDPSNPVQEVMLPLLRRLASNIPQLSHTKTVTCPFNVHKSSIKLVPRKMSSSSTLSSIVYDIQFTLDATEACTVKVFFCVDETLSNRTYVPLLDPFCLLCSLIPSSHANAPTSCFICSFEYHDASTGAKLGVVPSTTGSSLPSGQASSSSSSSGLGYVEKKFGVGLGQTFFTLGSEALDVTKFSVSDLIWNQLEQQLESDQAMAKYEESTSDSEGSDSDTAAQIGAESSESDMPPVQPVQPSSDDNDDPHGGANDSALVDEEAGVVVRRRRSRRRRREAKQKLPALPRPKPAEKPMLVRNLFPLVICVEPLLNGEIPSQKAVVEAQITHACLVRKEDPSVAESPDSVASSSSTGDVKFDCKVLRQKLLVNGAVYTVYDIFGVEQDSSSSSSSASSLIDGGLQSTCVICMSEPRTTLVIPCRHMCLCEDCAETLKVQSVKCPICRGPVRSLLKIEIDSNDDENEEDASHEQLEGPKRGAQRTKDLEHSEDEDDEDDHSVHTSLVRAAK